MGDEETELEWSEYLEESYPEYSDLSDALTDVQVAMKAIIDKGLMTEELRQDLYKLAKGVMRKLEEPDPNW